MCIVMPIPFEQGVPTVCLTSALMMAASISECWINAGYAIDEGPHEILSTNSSPASGS
jgi:hypothetical protein